MRDAPSKAAYFFCSDPEKDPVAHLVFREANRRLILEGAGFEVDGYEVLRHRDAYGNVYDLVRTADVLSHAYPQYLPILTAKFTDADFAGLINWHEGANAPSKILCAHTTGDVASGVYGTAAPQYTRNLLRALEDNRKIKGLDDWTVTSEATHWSGIPHGGSPEMIARYDVPLMDIEIGSGPDDWTDTRAVAALTASLTQVFGTQEPALRSLLCVGGIHFEPAFRDIVLHPDLAHPLAVTHVLANQWLTSGRYEDETGLTRLSAAAESIRGGADALVFHDNLKGAYKNQCRMLADRLGIPVFKHQRLRAPAELGLW
jgi:D-tyrosyl-tRNA(Tyr) deacylase